MARKNGPHNLVKASAYNHQWPPAVRKDLAGVGRNNKGSSLGQRGFDLAYMAGNGLPSAALKIVCPEAGIVSSALSATGNSYAEARKAGYSPEESVTYAAVAGATDAVLGQLTKEGGTAAKNAIEKVKAGIPSIVTLAASEGISGGSAYLQSKLEEAYREIIFDKKGKIRSFSEEELCRKVQEAFLNALAHEAWGGQGGR